MHLQPLLRSSHRSPVSSILKGHQRSAAPAAGDLRKKPVLDGIELELPSSFFNNYYGNFKRPRINEKGHTQNEPRAPKC